MTEIQASWQHCFRQRCARFYPLGAPSSGATFRCQSVPRQATVQSRTPVRATTIAIAECARMNPTCTLCCPQQKISPQPTATTPCYLFSSGAFPLPKTAPFYIPTTGCWVLSPVQFETSTDHVATKETQLIGEKGYFRSRASWGVLLCGGKGPEKVYSAFSACPTGARVCSAPATRGGRFGDIPGYLAAVRCQVLISGEASTLYGDTHRFHLLPTVPPGD
jgi:hypothetical protein